MENQVGNILMIMVKLNKKNWVIIKVYYKI